MCHVWSCLRRGDADGEGTVNIADAIRILSFLFSGTGTIDCLEAADADDNGAVELTDAVRILAFLFLGQAAPEPPGHLDCGPDPENENPDLSCDSYDSC